MYFVFDLFYCVHISESSEEIPDAECCYSDLYHCSEMFLAALSLGPCVIVIDGVDELSTSRGLTAQQVTIG